jgi:hypothetical protein
MLIKIPTLIHRKPPQIIHIEIQVGARHERLQFLRAEKGYKSFRHDGAEAFHKGRELVTALLVESVVGNQVDVFEFVFVCHRL